MQIFSTEGVGTTVNIVLPALKPSEIAIVEELF
jgi:hypothetical protein